MKIRLYKTLVKPIVLYACETWASTKSDESKLMILERKILRRIFGPKRNEEGNYEIRSNRELNGIFNKLNKPNIVATFKSQRIRWARHVWRAQNQPLLTITNWKFWKFNKSRPRGRLRQRWVTESKKLLSYECRRTGRA